ncbi:MAG: aminopeptidase [Candidatus Woesearchaeota archaeon]
MNFEDVKKEYEEYLSSKIGIFKKVLSYNLNLTNEELLIIGDKGEEDKNVSGLLTYGYSLAAKELGIKHKMLLQDRKEVGQDADKKIVNSMVKLDKGNVLLINTSQGIGGLGEIGKSYRKFAAKRNHRFGSASSLGTITNDNLRLVVNCLDVDYKKLQKKTLRLKEKLDNTSEVHVKTKLGTDILYNIEGIEARDSTGVYHENGKGGNIPGAEAYTAPNGKKVEGTIVIDGSSNVKTTTVKVKNPIELEIKNGSITNINDTMEATMLNNTLKWAQAKAKYPDRCIRIGELGIGLNERAKIIGSTIIDEKVLGTAHFAIGSNYWFGGDIKSIIHLDQVIKNPVIKLDGKRLII